MSFCVLQNKKYPLVQGKLIQPQQLIFQEWVKMSCFYCGKYNSNWKCPPRLPEKIDFEKMVREFPVGAFIFSRTPFSEKDYGEVRNTSSLHLHKAFNDGKPLMEKQYHEIFILYWRFL